MSKAFTGFLLICGLLWPSVTGYLMQKISQCSFSDDRQGNITFDTGFTLNRQLVLFYSKDDRMYLYPFNSIPEMKAVASKFAYQLNTNPDTAIQVQKEEDRCKEGVKTFWNKTVERRDKPSVEVFCPVQVHTETLPVLLCYVWGFYPQDINVAWFKNDILVKNHTEVVRSGDWTYRTVASLDLRDSRPEDNYTCLVSHPTLDTPIVKQWKHGLTNTQIIKISVASVIFALGLACLITGIVCWTNSKSRGYSPIPGINGSN